MEARCELGKSRAKMTEPDEKEKEDKKNNKKKITFDDVAGLSERKRISKR